MKKSAIAVLAIVVFNLGTCLGQFDIVYHFIRQKVDNFDPTNDKFFVMKYLSNNYYHRKGGPIFIDVGGQNGIIEASLFRGHFVDIAKELGAYLFHTEHRYYGESTVTEDLSLENLKFLNMKQAMADLLHFIKHIKETIPDLANSKVILKGEGYAGGLAVWFKHLYPNLVDGVWASSAKLFGAIKNSALDDVMAESIKLVGGHECYERIRNGISLLEDMVKDTSEQPVHDLLNLCPDFDTSKLSDLWNLFDMIGTAFVDVVVLHSPANREINKLCEIVLSADGHLNGVTAFLKTVFKAEPCTDATFKNALTPYRDTRITYDSARLSFYQQCNELGWFPTRNSPNSFLKFPLFLFYETKCVEIFGREFNIDNIFARIRDLENFFKRLTPSLDNVFLTHGQLDPWKAVGKLENLPTELIPMVGRAHDLLPISSIDTEILRAVKEKIKNLITGWAGIL